MNLKWRKCKNAISNVGYGGPVEILKGKLYVRSTGAAILVYIPEEDRWGRYCCTPDEVEDFAMTVMNDQLVIAGGEVHNKVCNKLAVWNKTSKKWEYPYPHMPTPRRNARLISYLHYLIAVGGEIYSQSNYYLIKKAVMNVEILDASRLQWYIGESLPKPCSKPQSVCIVDTLYLLQDCSPNDFFRASLSILVFEATSKHRTGTPTWEKLPDMPFQCSGLVAYDGTLLAFDRFRSQVIPSIHAYNADTNEWTKVGNFPSAFDVKLCVSLLSNEFFVICRQHTYRTNEYEVYIGIPELASST